MQIIRVTAAHAATRPARRTERSVRAFDGSQQLVPGSSPPTSPLFAHAGTLVLGFSIGAATGATSSMYRRFAQNEDVAELKIDMKELKRMVTALLVKNNIDVAWERPG